MNLIDKVLNERYKVTEKIDEGGMAIVYKSTDLLLVRTVAIKVLKDRFAKNKNVLERFYREARSAGGLSHQACLLKPMRCQSLRLYFSND